MQGYPTANKTDVHRDLRPMQVVGLSDPPERILIVCAQSNGVDLLLDKLASFSSKWPIVRLGQSNSREDLNKKYTLEIARKNDATAY